LGNLISGNTGRGVYISYEGDYTATNTNVLGNFIGTDITGAAALGNQVGVEIDQVSGNNVGGTTPGSRNVISGNSQAGVIVNGVPLHVASNNAVRDNYIGVAQDGTSQLSNHGHGVLVFWSTSNTTVANNVIWFNDITGVTVLSAPGGEPEATGVGIAGNSIDRNGGLGIDLGNAGSDTNDGEDNDSGANGLQNYPVLSSAQVSGSDLFVSGTLHSTNNTAFRIRFYRSPVCNASQGGAAEGDTHGEGRFEFGSTDVVTDGAGNVAFSPTITGAGVAVGEAVTATATATMGNSTSEFSLCITANAPEPDGLQADAGYWARRLASMASGSLLSDGRRSRNAR
jgi:titin